MNRFELVISLFASMLCAMFLAPNVMISSQEGTPITEQQTIVYFRGMSDTLNSVQSELSSVADDILIVNDWRSVPTTNGSRIDALIVDYESIDLVDSEWVAQAYQQGMVVSGINVDGRNLSSLLNTRCSVKTDHYTEAHYAIMSRTIIGENPDDVALVSAVMEDSCSREPEVPEFDSIVIFTVGTSTSTLTERTDYEEFTGSVRAHIQNMRSNQAVFNEQISMKNER